MQYSRPGPACRPDFTTAVFHLRSIAMSDQNPNQTSDNARSASERIEKGAERVKGAASSAAESTHKATDRAEQGMHRGADKMAGAAEYAAEHGREKLDDAMECANDWMGKTRDYVREHPGQTLVMAVAAGWLVARIMHHRH